VPDRERGAKCSGPEPAKPGAKPSAAKDSVQRARRRRWTAYAAGEKLFMAKGCVAATRSRGERARHDRPNLANWARSFIGAGSFQNTDET